MPLLFHLAAYNDEEMLLALSCDCYNGSAMIMDGEEKAGQIAQVRLRQPREQRIIAPALRAHFRLETVSTHREAALLATESGVESVYFNELVMAPLLDDPAVIQDYNSVHFAH